MQRSLVISIYRSQGHWKTCCQFKAFLTLGSLKAQCTHDISLVQPLGYFCLQKRASHQKHCPSTARRDFFNHANQTEKIAIFLHILNKNILHWILVSFYTNQTKIHLLANVSICVVQYIEREVHDFLPDKLNANSTLSNSKDFIGLVNHSADCLHHTETHAKP